MNLVTLVLLCFVIPVSADQASDLLKDSDRSRGGLDQGLTWKVKLESVEDGDTAVREYLVKAKGENAYVEALTPARNKGEIILFNDRLMWFFKSTLKKPVSISARQKLSGQAANGDVASTNYYRDYTPKLEKTETLQGEKTFVVLLKAKGENLTYEQIRYWISEKSHLAIKADYLTMQGEVFKTSNMAYKNTLSVNGKVIPFISQIELFDAKNSKNKSTMIYESPKLENPADSLFNKNNLTR